MFLNNLLKRAMPMRPAPQPVNPMGVSGRSMMSAFGQPIARVPQPAPQPVRPPFTSAFGQPFARAPQPVQGPSAFAGMFGNGGFGQPLPPFTSAFGQPIARAPQPIQSPFLGGLGGGQPMPAQQTPQPTTGLSGLGALSPEQITQLQNSMGPQTLPANINQELAKMNPSTANGPFNFQDAATQLGMPGANLQNADGQPLQQQAGLASLSPTAPR
jgi:hypothetical protein